MDGLSCITVYEWLCTRDDIQNLYYEFVVDDHASWPKEKDEKTPQSSSVQKKWQSVAKQTVFDHKQKVKRMTMETPFLYRGYRQKNRSIHFHNF